MGTDLLLSRLDRVREHAHGRWTARCPAHGDRNPSLSIRETADGTILIRCFAGCCASEVMAAVGLSLRDLFPEGRGDHIPPIRDRKHQHAAREALKTLHREVLIVAIAGETLAAGTSLDEADRNRLWEAIHRIRQVAEAVT